MQTIEIRSPEGPLLATVDDEDYAVAASCSWHMAGGKGNKGKYAASAVKVGDKRTTVYMHRLVAQRMGLIKGIGSTVRRGRWSMSIDHINGDKLDNRRENLRLRDRPQQMRNGNDGLRTTNRSGHRGVSFVKGRERFGKPWMAYVTVNYKTINLGWYATADEAAAARRAWNERQSE